jgi:hypothetical protein
MNHPKATGAYFTLKATPKLELGRTQEMSASVATAELVKE